MDLPPGPSWLLALARRVSGGGQRMLDPCGPRQCVRAFRFAPAASCASPAIRCAAATSPRICPPKMGPEDLLHPRRGPRARPRRSRSIVWAPRRLQAAPCPRPRTAATPARSSRSASAPAFLLPTAQSAARCRARSAKGPPPERELLEETCGPGCAIVRLQAKARSHFTGDSSGLRGRRRERAGRPARLQLARQYWRTGVVKYGASWGAPMAGPLSTAATSAAPARMSARRGLPGDPEGRDCCESGKADDHRGLGCSLQCGIQRRSVQSPNRRRDRRHSGNFPGRPPCYAAVRWMPGPRAPCSRPSSASALALAMLLRQGRTRLWTAFALLNLALLAYELGDFLDGIIGDHPPWPLRLTLGRQGSYPLPFSVSSLNFKANLPAVCSACAGSPPPRRWPRWPSRFRRWRWCRRPASPLPAPSSSSSPPR